jgi:hypothetical protein
VLRKGRKSRKNTISRWKSEQKTEENQEKPKRILHSKKKKSGSEISGTGQNAWCKKNKKNRKKNENYTSAPNPCPVLTGTLSGGNTVKSFGVRQATAGRFVIYINFSIQLPLHFSC